MKKLNVTIFGLDLYVAGDKDDADKVNEALGELLAEVYDPKPNWYYKAKARDRLGIS